MSAPHNALCIPLLPALVLCAAVGAQERKAVAYPQEDALTPFRAPAEIYAPPDQIYALLRRMQAMAADPNNERRTDEHGREEVMSERWLDMRNEAQRVGIDAGYLASIMRLSRSDDDRRTAFYGMFYCSRVDYVLNLIAHIPGEPLRATRQEALPRAIEYLRVHLNRRFGDLTDEQKDAVRKELPAPGSPVAKSRGITRAPQDDDPLYLPNLVPFFQLLDVDAAIDQAQGLWFLKEVFTIRPELARQWLEPSLPRVLQLLVGDDREARVQAVGLLQTVAPADLQPIADVDDATDEELLAWAKAATRAAFPPIRNVNDAYVVMFPSEERDALVAAGLDALRDGSIGDPFRGKNAAGQYFSGYRIANVPAALEPLAIQKGAVITAVNGMPVMNADTLLQALRHLLSTLPKPQKLLVEYVLDDKPAACEYRIM